MAPKRKYVRRGHAATQSFHKKSIPFFRAIQKCKQEASLNSLVYKTSDHALASYLTEIHQSIDITLVKSKRIIKKLEELKK